MKKLIAIIILSLNIISVYAQKTDYYYYKGKKISLEVNPNLVYVSSADSMALLKTAKSSEVLQIQAGKYQSKKKSRYWAVVETNKSRSKTDIKLLLNKSLQTDYYIAPVIGNEHPIATSEIFYVKLKLAEDYNKLLDFSEQQNCEIIEEVPYTPLWYKLQAPINLNGLAMSNIFYESAFFEDIDPGFMFNFEPNCTNEPDFSKQWGLNAINVCNAWNITKGKPEIIVAVIDRGIDQTHNEFKNNFHPKSYDLINRSIPSVVRGSHGTHVGGIIGANQNGIQISGVAPNASLLSISHPIYSSNTMSSELAAGINYAWQNGAAVINNSWGDQGGRLYYEMHSSMLENAISDAITKGRNGLGCVVVFATGNQFKGQLDYPVYCNPEILAVGSINSSYQKAPSSSWGAGIDVVAPGESILSTIPGNQIKDGNGTSMAAPHVAGIAALLLSVNPNLTGKEVRNAIESSCRKVGGYSYNTNKANGTWNNEMGYGLVDAYAAIQKSITNNAYITRVSYFTAVCTSGRTLKIEGLQTSVSDSQIKWTCSSNMEIQGGNTGRTKVIKAKMGFDGPGWISASISAYGIDVPLKNQYDVWVGVPTPNYIRVQQTYGNTLQAIWNYNTNSMSAAEYISAYEWSMPGYSIEAHPNYESDLPSMHTVRFSGYSSSGDVRVRACNECGWSKYSIPFPVNTSMSYSSYSMVYPNPVSGILNVDFIPKEEDKNQQFSTSTKVEKKNNIVVILFKTDGTLVRKLTSKEEKMQIDVSDLPNDNYILHVYNGSNKEPEVHRIFVNN